MITSSLDLCQETSGMRRLRSVVPFSKMLLAVIGLAIVPTDTGAQSILIRGRTYTPTGPTGAVTATFTTADGGVTTNLYHGFVALTVSGIGVSAFTDLNDAFYVFTDPSGNPIKPLNDPTNYQLAIGTGPLAVHV